MGAILAKFRKSPTTFELLEELEEKIQEIENYSVNTQLQKKKFVGNFLATSIGVYVIAFIVFYFVYFPPTWKERLAYFVPLLVFPIVVFLLRRLFTWHFERKLNKKSKELAKLRAEKKNILEQVKDKETYKVASQLLDRFGDQNTNKYSFAMTPRPAMNASHAIRSLSNSRTDVTSSSTQMTPSTTSLRLKSPSLTETLSQTKLQKSVNTNFNNNMSKLKEIQRPLTMSPLSKTTNSPNYSVDQELRRRRTPFPIVNQDNKGVFERIVDILVGDGPQDRFAMICKNCFAHNGMALKEEFDYATFRCAFCHTMNQARKERPVGPRLPIQQNLLEHKSTASSESSSSDNESDSFIRPVPSMESNVDSQEKVEETINLNTQRSAESINSQQSDHQSEISESSDSIENATGTNVEKDEDEQFLEKLTHDVEELEKNFMHLDKGVATDKVNELLESKLKKLAI